MTFCRLVYVGACLFVLPLHADDTAPVTDPAEVTRHYHQVISEPQYQEPDESQINLRVEDWLSHWFRRIGTEVGDFKYANRMPAFESLLMSLLVLFSLTILLYVMVRLTRRRGRMDEEPDAPGRGQAQPREPEFYDREIDEAVRAGEWHTAWRAAWRQFLSGLERRNLVEADRTRTNREYLAQLRAKPLPGSALALLTHMVDAYDLFIYGRRQVNEPDWTLFHRQLGETALLLHLDDPARGAKRSAP